MKTQIIRATLVLMGSFAFAACQTTTPAPKAAVSCDKCATVFFQAPTLSGPGSKLVTLTQSSKMICPSCVTRATAILKGTSLTSHTCKECGGTMRHCTAH